MAKKTKPRKNARLLGIEEKKKRVKNLGQRRTKTGIVTRDVRRKAQTKKNKRLS